MPMIFSEMAEERVDCRLKFGGQELAFTFNLAAVSLEQEFKIFALSDQLRKALDHTSSFPEIKKLRRDLEAAIIPLLVEWDAAETVEDADAGSYWPIDAAHLGKLPGPMLIGMTNALRKVTTTVDPDDAGPEVAGAA